VPRPDVQCPGSQFFSARVRQYPAEVRRVHCVPASAVRCIPRARLLPARVLSVLVRGFRLRDRFVPAVVLVLPRVGPASAMFRVA
jgi:hypothetical protein